MAITNSDAATAPRLAAWVIGVVESVGESGARGAEQTALFERTEPREARSARRRKE